MRDELTAEDIVVLIMCAGVLLVALAGWLWVVV